MTCSVQVWLLQFLFCKITFDKVLYLYFTGATGSIIDVLNDQWRCSIESINISPQPILGTHIAQNLSAAEHQPRVSGHHPATSVGDNGADPCKKPAASFVHQALVHHLAVVHEAPVHHPAVVHEAPVHQQAEKCVTVVLSNEIRPESDPSRRKSLRVRERRQRLSRESRRASGNACNKTKEDAKVDKTGILLKIGGAHFVFKL